MKKIQLSDSKRYVGPNHRDMISLKLHGVQESGCKNFWVGMSHVLPGGGVPMQASTAEQVYFVLEGEVTFLSKSETVVVKAWDSLYVGPDEEREMINTTNVTCTVLVIKGGGESVIRYV